VRESNNLGPPAERPAGEPPQGYGTDALVAIGRLTSQVDRLIKDVEANSAQIVVIQSKISFVKGAMWVIGGAVALIIVIAGWYLKWTRG
jgi:hypothetical protein